MKKKQVQVPAPFGVKFTCKEEKFKQQVEILFGLGKKNLQRLCCINHAGCGNRVAACWP